MESKLYEGEVKTGRQEATAVVQARADGEEERWHMR